MKWIEDNRECLAVALCAAVVFFTRSWEGDLHGDPLRYAAIAKTMVETGDWLTPQDQPGVLYANKPPLMLWLVAVNFTLFGVGIYAAKFWSCLFALASCVLTCLVGRRLFGRGAGLLAGCMAATFIGVPPNAVDLRLDSSVTLAVVATMYAVIRAVQTDRPRWLLVAGLAAGLGMMIKPITPIHVGVLTILLLGILRRRWLLHPYLLVAMLLAVIVAGPWHVAMTKLHGDAFTDIYFGREMGTRLVAGGHSLVSLWKNIFAVVTRGLPWWPLAAYALARWRRAGTRERVGMTVAGLWLMEIVLTMAVPSVRYDRYVLPAYPALALLAGYGMDLLLTERARQALPRIVLTLTVAAGLLFALVPIQLHTYGRPNYVFARQLLDAYNVGDAVAFVDPECTPGLSRAPEHWSIRAAVVYYLDRGLVNYSNPENAIRDGHRFAVVLETQRDFIEPWGYEPVVKLDNRRWLMSRTPDRPGGSPAQ